MVRELREREGSSERTKREGGREKELRKLLGLLDLNSK